MGGAPRPRGLFAPDKVDQPGYFQEGWSAKDLIAHIGSWLAEAGMVLERIRFGTYQQEEIDIDAMNQAFYEAMHDVPFAVVRTQRGRSPEQDAPRLAIAPGSLAGGGQMDLQGRSGSTPGAAEVLRLVTTGHPRFRPWSDPTTRPTTSSGSEPGSTQRCRPGASSRGRGVTRRRSAAAPHGRWCTHPVRRSTG